MAKYYFGINAGEEMDQVAVGTSTTGKDIELVVDNTNISTKLQTALAIDKLETFVDGGNWPPA